jgi:hypothetical protein
MAMLILKFLALVFAVLVLVKIIMLVVARDYWLGLVEKAVASGNRGLAIYAGVAAVVGVLLLSQVSVIVVGAVMLWTGLLMGLALMPYGEMMLKWRDEIAQQGLGKIWWVLAIWVGLAVWILAAVFGE